MNSAPKDTSPSPRRLSPVAAWAVVGSAVVGASAAMIARPGFHLGEFFLGILMLACGRLMGEMGLVLFIERATGLGKVVWEAVGMTRPGEWLGRKMATSKVFSLVTSVAFFLVVIFASEDLARNGFSLAAAAASFAAGAIYVVWHAIAERLGRAYEAQKVSVSSSTVS